MSEELRTGRQKRHDRRLVDVTPRRPKATDHEVELVAKETVMRVGDEVNDEGNERGRSGDVPARRRSWSKTPALILCHDADWGVPFHGDSTLLEPPKVARKIAQTLAILLAVCA